MIQAIIVVFGKQLKLGTYTKIMRFYLEKIVILDKVCKKFENIDISQIFNIH